MNAVTLTNRTLGFVNAPVIGQRLAMALLDETVDLDVYDRIGGGDAYLAGVLYGLLKGYAPDDCLDLGWAVSALAVSGPLDYAQPASEKQLWEICRGNAQIVR